MKKQLNQLRRFFARTGAKRLNAATAREALPGTYDDDDTDTRLSGAFVVVLLLHIVALVGVFAFSRVKDRSASTVQPASENTPVSAAAAPLATPAAHTGTPREEGENLPPVPTPEQPATPVAAAGRTHIVKAGDNLTRIALAHGVSPAEVVAVNKLKSQDDLKIGQELQMPSTRSMPPAPPKTATKLEAAVAPPAKSAPSTYKIKKGDTLVAVARDLGVSYEELAEINKIKDPRKIQINQVLKVPGKH